AGDNALRCIAISGDARATTVGGITFAAASPSQFWIQGITFEGFTSAALNISGGQGNLVRGNQFGAVMRLRATSIYYFGHNAIDIWLYGADTTTLIGGGELGNRNVIATASASMLAAGNDTNYGGRGIAIPSYGGSHGNTIAGNLIGLDAYEE